MGKDSERDKYSEEEAQRRFMQSLKGAVNTPPKPLKSMNPRRPRSQGTKSKGKKDVETD